MWGGVGVILQKSGTAFTTHRHRQTTTSYKEEMKILKKQEALQKEIKF